MYFYTTVGSILLSTPPVMDEDAWHFDEKPYTSLLSAVTFITLKLHLQY
jgi:hypothetical protein